MAADEVRGLRAHLELLSHGVERGAAFQLLARRLRGRERERCGARLGQRGHDALADLGEGLRACLAMLEHLHDGEAIVPEEHGSAEAPVGERRIGEDQLLQRRGEP